MPDREGLDSEEGKCLAYSRVEAALTIWIVGWNLETDLGTLMNEIKEFHPSLQAACTYAKPP
jgi:hypothetical protein